jgi:hypothetical protein
MKRICKDYGDRPGCLREPDERYTMDFSDIGEGQILWCAHCGPDAQRMKMALEEALATRGPEFREELAEEIRRAKEEIPVQ